MRPPGRFRARCSADRATRSLTRPPRSCGYPGGRSSRPRSGVTRDPWKRPQTPEAGPIRPERGRRRAPPRRCRTAHRARSAPDGCCSSRRSARRASAPSRSAASATSPAASSAASSTPPIVASARPRTTRLARPYCPARGRARRVVTGGEREAIAGPTEVRRRMCHRGRYRGRRLHRLDGPPPWGRANRRGSPMVRVLIVGLVWLACTAAISLVIGRAIRRADARGQQEADRRHPLSPEPAHQRTPLPATGDPDVAAQPHRARGDGARGEGDRPPQGGPGCALGRPPARARPPSSRRPRGGGTT